VIASGKGQQLDARPKRNQKAEQSPFRPEPTHLGCQFDGGGDAANSTNNEPFPRIGESI
jgi:hypothetical protein